MKQDGRIAVITGAGSGGMRRAMVREFYLTSDKANFIHVPRSLPRGMAAVMT
jgi:NAD(P)-dependent dehydrogenase (short-subunit alcohol dehydrogenase family)